MRPVFFERIVLLLGVALLSGCGTVDDGFVMKQWTRNMRELGVYPKYPVEEDVKVGDVYAIPEDDRTVDVNGIESIQGPLTFAHVVGRVGTPKMIGDHYASRYGYEGARRREINADTALAFGTNETTLMAKAYPQEIRRVAFPHFFRVKATGAQVGALVPVGQIAAKLGLDARSVESATVTVDDAASVALPMPYLASKLVKPDGTLNTAELGYATPEIARPFLPVKVRDPNKGMIELFVVNQVYYARAFDISLGVSSDAKAGLLRGAQGGSSGTAGSTSVSQPIGSGQQQAAAPAGVSPTGTATAIQSATTSVENALKSGITSLVPAAGFNLVASQSQSGTVGLTQVYDRYLAIGYRGAKLIIDPRTFRVVTVRAPSLAGHELAIHEKTPLWIPEDATNPKEFK